MKLQYRQSKSSASISSLLLLKILEISKVDPIKLGETKMAGQNQMISRWVLFPKHGLHLETIGTMMDKYLNNDKYLNENVL